MTNVSLDVHTPIAQNILTWLHILNINLLYLSYLDRKVAVVFYTVSHMCTNILSNQPGQVSAQSRVENGIANIYFQIGFFNSVNKPGQIEGGVLAPVGGTFQPTFLLQVVKIGCNLQLNLWN